MFGMLALMVAIFYLLFVLIALGAAIVTIIGEWKVFEKAGKPGWAAIIPFYNNYVLYQIGDMPVALIAVNIGTVVFSLIQSMVTVLYTAEGIFRLSVSYEYTGIIAIMGVISSCGGIACLILNILTCINVAKKFGKSAGYGVGLALLPFVFFMMLGFDKNAKYCKNAEFKDVK